MEERDPELIYPDEYSPETKAMVEYYQKKNIELPPRFAGSTYNGF